MAENNENRKKNGPGRPAFNFYWIWGIIVVVLITLNFLTWNQPTHDTNINDFKEKMALKGHVEKILIVNKEIAEVWIKKDSLTAAPHKELFKGKKVDGPHYLFNTGPADEFRKDLRDIEAACKQLEDASGNKLKYTFKYDYIVRENWGRDVLGWVLPIILMVAIWIFLMRRLSGGPGGGGGQIFNIGKSRAQLFDKEKSTNITFNDVAGLEGAKEEIQEIVDFLKNPKKYTELGAKIPKGALLVGPPGTGKTLLAKAVAGEAQVPFFSLSGSDFVEMFVGVGASRVRDLFRQAKEKAPCIIFIDEIDAIGRARGKSPSLGSNDERENTLNQLLTEMDGFGTNSGVIILAATNRADILDRALMRPGRFDRMVYVDLPDLNERKKIFAVHLRPLKVSEGLDIDFLARQTPGFSGADIANICNEAALIAARKKKKTVEKQDFLDAVDRVIGGLEKKNKIVSKEEKKVIAYHEAGHAAVSWLLQYASPLVKVTIVPRGQSLGAAWYLPEERQITRTEQMLDEMCATLGGRASEKVTFDKISTGALSDLERVTKMAYAMVSIYGLNENLGNISYYDPQGSEYAFSKPYSEKRAELIDEEVSKIIEGQFERAVKLLNDNKDKLQKLAELLLEKEVIFKEDLETIFGKRPYDKEEEKPAEEKPSEETSTTVLNGENTSNEQNNDGTLFGNTIEWDNPDKKD
ncbi:MAG: ATP-dependent zinc metalloprotease FtsH [Flavobacteriales bacterium]|nr:ATP-dependent zinc metalloprotease FtsH [Flavobacteriales bacterium]